MNEAGWSDFWGTYLWLREVAVIVTCVLFFLCGAWWFIPMNLITFGSFTWAGWLTAHAAYAQATLVNDLGIAIVAGLAVLTYKRRFFLSLFLASAVGIWSYLIYLDLNVPVLGMW
jgi:hypothetical protein